MAKSQRINLKLAQAPLLLAAYFYGPQTKVVINWPRSLLFTEVKLKEARLNKTIADKLTWIARQYTALNKHPQTRRYALHVVPYLAKVDLNIEASQTDLVATAIRLKRIPLDYTKAVADSLMASLKIESDLPTIGQTDGKWTKDGSLIRLISAEPLNELELGLLPYYHAQDVPWAVSLAGWLKSSYEQKAGYFEQALMTSPDLNYRLELVAEPGRVASLTKLGGFEVIGLQAPNPNFGYELPPIASDGGMMERCFDTSYELYGQVQALQSELAQLFTLWGHRQRALVSVRWEHLLNLQKISGVHGGFAKAILTKVAEKHPLLIESLVQPGK